MVREDSHNGADRGLRTVKAPGAFRTISEVAGEIDVPQHVLRFWETKFNQVKPLKRAGGRRYYRPEDVALLGRIRGLLYEEGYTIKGVQKLLRSGGLKALEHSGPTPAEAPSSAEEAGRDGPHRPVDQGEPEGARPEGARPEGARPEGARPEGARPEGARPEGARPEGGKAEGFGAEGAKAGAARGAEATAPREVDQMRAELKSLRRELAVLRDMLRDKSRS